MVVWYFILVAKSASAPSGSGSGRFSNCLIVRPCELAFYHGKDLESGVFGFDFYTGGFADKAAVDKHHGGVCFFLHRFQILDQFLLVVGRLDHVLVEDEA